MEELAHPMHEIKSELCESEGTPSKQIKITSYDEFEAYLTPTRGCGRGRGHGKYVPGAAVPGVQQTLSYLSETVPNVKVGSDEHMRQQSLGIQHKMEDTDTLLLAKLPKKFASTIWQVLQVSNLTVNKTDVVNIAMVPPDSFYCLCVPLFPEIRETKMEMTVAQL